MRDMPVECVTIVTDVKIKHQKLSKHIIIESFPKLDLDTGQKIGKAIVQC